MAQTDSQSATIGGKLKSLEITLANYRKDKTIDLRPFITDITIYENIFNPTLHGVMTVIDSVGFLSGYAFSIVGEEYLNIKYEIPDNAIPKKSLDFFVHKISPVFNAENYKHKRYLIYFCSIEHIEDAANTIQKAYSKPISDIVKDVVKTFLRSKKTVEVEETRGVQNLIIPALDPFDAIEFLRQRSIAKEKYTSASYLFFETTEGFKFCDIEYLIEKGREKIKKNAEKYTYYVTQSDLQRSSGSNDSGDDSDPRNYNKIEFKTLFSFIQNHRVDTIEKMKMGMYSSAVQVLDVINLTVSQRRFGYDPTKTIAMGKFSENSNDFDTDMAFNRTGFMRWWYKVKDSTVPEQYADQIAPNSASYMTRLGQNMFTAKCLGDPSLLAGDLITVPKMPAFRTPDGHGNDDKYLAGEFLVIGFVHKFGQESYVCDVELYRNGYAADVEKPISLDD